MKHERSVTLIIAAAQADNANKVCWALGHQGDPANGNNTFSVRLSVTGNEPATHLAAHSFEKTRGQGGLLSDLKDAQDRTLRSITWSDFGLRAADALVAIDAIEVTDIFDGRARTNFATRLSGRTLQEIVSE